MEEPISISACMFTPLTVALITDACKQLGELAVMQEKTGARNTALFFDFVERHTLEKCPFLLQKKHSASKYFAQAIHMALKFGNIHFTALMRSDRSKQLRCLQLYYYR